MSDTASLPGVAKTILTAWPSVVEQVTKRLYPLLDLLDEKDGQEVAAAYEGWNAAPTPAPPADPGIVRIEDVSQFVQQMAVVEGQVRTGSVKAGCNCKMDVTAKIIHSSEVDAVVQVFTMHEPICGFAQKLRLDHPELEEDAEKPEGSPDG